MSSLIEDNDYLGIIKSQSETLIFNETELIKQEIEETNFNYEIFPLLTFFTQRIYSNITN